MKKTISRILGVLMLCGSSFTAAVPITSEMDPTLADAVLIDFENVAAGRYTTLNVDGATITTAGGYLTICDGCGGSGFGDEGQSLNNNGRPNTGFDISFSDVVSAFGISFGAINAHWTISAFDTLNNLVETSSVTSPCCGGFYHGIAANDIARVSLRTNYDWVVFDNLRYTPQVSTVSEPASLALLGLGLVAGTVVTRRRKTADHTA